MKEKKRVSVCGFCLTCWQEIESKFQRNLLYYIISKYFTVIKIYCMLRWGKLILEGERGGKGGATRKLRRTTNTGYK